MLNKYVNEVENKVLPGLFTGISPEPCRGILFPAYFGQNHNFCCAYAWNDSFY